MKTKLLIIVAVLAMIANAETKRLTCEFYSEIVTNWSTETTPYNGIITPFYDFSLQKRGSDIGVVSSNYNVSLYLKLQKKTFALSSVELFKINKPWKEVTKVEKVYDTPMILTNLWGGGYYVTNSHATNWIEGLTMTNIFYVATNTTLTNIGYNLFFEDGEWKR